MQSLATHSSNALCRLSKTTRDTPLILPGFGPSNLQCPSHGVRFSKHEAFSFHIEKARAVALRKAITNGPSMQVRTQGK